MWTLTPDRLQRCADIIRLFASGTMVERDECVFYTRWLQRLSSGSLARGSMASHRAFSIDCLVQCVLFSGFLRQVKDCKAALLTGLRAVLGPEFSEPFAAQIRDGKAVPHVNTLYTHRLTLHLGWCLLRQQRNAARLDDSEGVIVHFTVDSSPQGGMDWLQSSLVVTRKRDLRTALDQATRLSCSQPGQPQPDEDCSECTHGHVLHRSAMCAQHCVGIHVCVLGVWVERENAGVRVCDCVHALHRGARSRMIWWPL